MRVTQQPSSLLLTFPALLSGDSRYVRYFDHFTASVILPSFRIVLHVISNWHSVIMLHLSKHSLACRPGPASVVKGPSFHAYANSGILSVSAALLSGTVGAANAVPSISSTRGRPSNDAPELDPSSICSGILLLTGGVLLLNERDRRNKQ
jgi:hypothetical protein